MCLIMPIFQFYIFVDKIPFGNGLHIWASVSDLLQRYRIIPYTNTLDLASADYFYSFNQAESENKNLR